MKAGKEHRVPLSDAAVAVLEAVEPWRDGDFVFPGQKRGKPLSNMALLVLLRRMGRGDLTAHGFRSTFRDWAAERTKFPRGNTESVLAALVDNALSNRLSEPERYVLEVRRGSRTSAVLLSSMAVCQSALVRR